MFLGLVRDCLFCGQVLMFSLPAICFLRVSFLSGLLWMNISFELRGCCSGLLLR